MARLLEFKKPEPETVPNYAGRVLALNPESGHTRFCCGGFLLGLKRLSAIVPADAQMVNIHQALQAGILLDITDNQDLTTKNATTLTGVKASDTSQKAYAAPWAKLKELELPSVAKVLADLAPEEKDLPDNQVMLVMTSDPDEQKILDGLVARPALVLPPGLDNPDKYLIKV